MRGTVLWLCFCHCLATNFISIPLKKAAHHHTIKYPTVALFPDDTDVQGGPTVCRPAPWFGETRLERVPALSLTTVYLGTPPRSFRVQVDTGSADLVIPGAQCESCEDDTRFFFNRSRTSRLPQLCMVNGDYEPCRFSVQYGDGTKVAGVLIRDRLALDVAGHPALDATVFVDLMLDAEPAGVFSGMGIDGIFGLGFDTITSNHMTSALTSIMQQHDLDDVFAMYVGSEVDANDGVLTVGGIDRRRFQGRLQFTPIIERSYYCVSTTALSIGSRMVIHDPDDFGVAFVDSGTTFTLLPETTFHAIQSFMQQHYCHLPLVCATRDKPGVTMFNNYCLVGKVLPKGFPVFHWRFHGGVTVDVPPEAYFRKIPYDGNGLFMYCFGIGPIKTRPLYTILGDTFMAASYVVFDRKAMRIGFGIPSSSPVLGTLPPPEDHFQITTVAALCFSFILLSSVLFCYYAERHSVPSERTTLKTQATLNQYGAV